MNRVVTMNRRYLNDKRTPEQRRRDDIAARNRAWIELQKILPVAGVMLTKTGERKEQGGAIRG